MPSTILHAVLPSSCALFERKGIPPDRRAWFRLVVVAAILANLPDLDILAGILMPARWTYIHRYWGHNLFAVTGWTALGYLLWRKWGCPKDSPLRAWVTSTALVWSHLALDAMNRVMPPGMRQGVPLLWPFSRHQFNLPPELFYGVPSQGRYANPFLDRVLSRELWHHYIFVEFFYGAILFMLFAVTISCLRKATHSVKPPAKSHVALDDLR